MGFVLSGLKRPFPFSFSIAQQEIKLAFLFLHGQQLNVLMNNFLFLQGYFWDYLEDRQHLLERFSWKSLIFQST